MRRVVFNQKGGVGKSTITCNLAAVAAAQGKKTLVLDLDPQCNTSSYLLGSGVGELQHTIADYFEQTLRLFPDPITEFISSTPFENLDILPAHPNLTELESKLESRYKMMKLREGLKPLSEDYDEIYIDTPPSLNFFSRSALIAADSCLIPFDCDEFSRQALHTLLGNIEEIKIDHNPELSVEGIVINRFQPRAKLPQRVVEDLKNDGHPVLEPYLNASVKVLESHEQAKPMIHLDPKHKLSEAYVGLYQGLPA